MSLRKIVESKESKIRKLNLTDEQKETLIRLFDKYNYLENKIDWNNPNLTWKDFESVLSVAGKSRSSQKKYGIEGLVEDKDYRYVGKGYNDTIRKYEMYQPLTYEGSKVLASNRVPPVKDNGAKWCISYQKTSMYWRSYAKEGITFLLLLTKDTKFAITKYLNGRIEVYSFDDKNLGNPQWLQEDRIIQEGLEDLEKVIIDDFKEVKRYLTIEEDNSISLLKENSSNLSDSLLRAYIQSHVVNGEFDVKFKRWEADFYCASSNLTSLKGAPKYVGGDFDCSFNKLTSLEGAPEDVKGGFLCYNNNLTSLEGSPRKIEGNFNCRYNNLTSLKGAPEYVGGNFDCSLNKLTSLLEAPKYVGGYFDCSFCPNLMSLEGASTNVGSKFSLDGYNLRDTKGISENIKIYQTYLTPKRKLSRYFTAEELIRYVKNKLRK